MKITFLGAAGEVTGSQHLIETSSRRLLLDCGLFQGPRARSRELNEKFFCDPKRLDAVFLSHAHIDHCGNLPGLYKAGFRGPVFCTEATADLTELMLKDSAHIQQEDARYLSRKLKPGHPRIDPLYNDEDVDALMKLVEPLPFHKWHSLGNDVRVRFLPAGHILGSAIVELELRDHGIGRSLVFSGDLGRRNMPLLVDPEPIEGCDVLICESTYGNRSHMPAGDLKAELARIIREASKVGGRVIIPAFSLGRTQQVVYFLNELFNAGALASIPVYVDSPLATRITRIFRRYDHTLNEDVRATLRHDDDVFAFDGLTYIGTQDESRSLNSMEGSFVVISAGGMCEGGRVVHHIKHAIRHEENTICIIGWQAPHTLGRQILERRPYARIFDYDVPLRAHVEVLNGLSAHADADDLQWWFREANRRGHIGKAFLVHGEPEAAQALALAVRDDCDEDPVIPQLYESFEV